MKPLVLLLVAGSLALGPIGEWVGRPEWFWSLWLLGASLLARDL